MKKISNFRQTDTEPWNRVFILKRFGLGVAIGMSLLLMESYLSPHEVQAETVVRLLDEPSVQESFKSAKHAINFEKPSTAEPETKVEVKPKVKDETRIEVKSEAKPEVSTEEKAKKHGPASDENEMQVQLKKANDHDVAAVKVNTTPAVAHTSTHAEHDKSKAATYSVQIASNPDKAASEALLKQLQAKGYHGFIQEAEVKGKQYYRVRLGPVATKDEAIELQNKVQQSRITASALISKD